MDTMTTPHYRYFIELQSGESANLPRAHETEQRRRTALSFLENMRNWLKEKDLDEKVSALNVTMFGQIQITCEADVITRIRNQENVDIAAIRQGNAFAENFGRLNEAR